MAVTTKNVEALTDLLKREGVEEVNALTSALKEINEERAEEKKEKCKELLRKALSLQSQMDQAEREFNASKKKFDNELGKVIRRLKGMDQGKTPEELDAEEANSDGGSGDGGSGDGGS